MFNKFTVFLGAASLCWSGDLDKGLEQFKGRHYSEAEQEMREVVKTEPRNSVALRILGLSLIHQGKNSEALPLLEDAVRAEPAFPDAKLALAFALVNEKRYDEAEKQVRAAAKQNDDLPDLPFYQGMVAVAKKQNSDAIPKLETAIERDPENSYAYYFLGLAYANSRRPDKMVGAFSNFLRLAPDAPEAEKVRSFLKASR